MHRPHLPRSLLSTLPLSLSFSLACALPACTTPATEPAPVVLAADDGIADAWLVQLVDDTDPADVEAIAGELLADSAGRLRHVYRASLVGFAVDGVTAPQVAALARDPRVARIEQDRRLTPPVDQGIAVLGAATQQATTQPALDLVDQRTRPGSCTYRADATGAGVDVYVIDSGVRVTHTEFEGRATALYDAVTNTAGVATDLNGHGTRVASLIGGKTYGVAKGARLLAVKVYNNGADATVSSFVAGVDFVTSRVRAQRAAGNLRTAVANLSIGLARGTTGQDLFTTAINTMSVNGIQPIVADSEDAASPCEAQAQAGGAITVGAIDPLSGNRAFGGSICADLYAPTGGMAADIGSDTAIFNLSFTGTSGAAPRVAGTAALHLQRFPTATVGAPDFCPISGTPSSSSLTCSLVGHATRDAIPQVPLGARTNRLVYSRLAIDPTVTVSTSTLSFTPTLGTQSAAQSVTVGLLSGTEPAEYRVETSGECWLQVTPAPNPIPPGQSCAPNYLTSTQPRLSIVADARTGRGCIFTAGTYQPATVRVIGTNGVVRTLSVGLSVQ